MNVDNLPDDITVKLLSWVSANPLHADVARLSAVKNGRGRTVTGDCQIQSNKSV
jgi:hypothetical protein